MPGSSRHDFTLILQKMAKGIKVFKRPNDKPDDKEKSRGNSPLQQTSPLRISPPTTPSPEPFSPASIRCLSPLILEVLPLPSKHRKKSESAKKQKFKRQEKIKTIAKKQKNSTCKADRTCIKCDAYFSDEEQIREHRDQNACKRVQCPQCEKMVLNLRIHTRRMHPTGEVFKCNHCSKSYSILSMLQRHMLVHTEVYEYQCDLCSYRGKRKEYLKIHMRTHGSERYLCSECPATFINQSNFNKHRVIHGNKNYQCDKCKKSFRYAKQLRCHDEAQHQKIRHPCAMCGQTFKYRTKLLKHELKVHNREKRKLNSFSTTIRTELPDPQNKDPSQMDASSVDNVPMETYLHFKKDMRGDINFYSR